MIMFGLLAFALCLFVACRTRSFIKRSGNRPVFAFFHPYTHGGGGGERVLWQAIQSMAENRKSTREDFQVVVYSGDIGIEEDHIIRSAMVTINSTEFV